MIQSKVAFASRSVSDQVKAWTRAVCLGQTIPMSIQNNLGTSSLIKFYNNNTHPRGLSYAAIRNCINKEFTENIRLIKSTYDRLFETIELHPEESDPSKLRRILAGAHDIWTNRNGQSFTTITVSYIDITGLVWSIKRVINLCHSIYMFYAFNIFIFLLIFIFSLTSTTLFLF